MLAGKEGVAKRGALNFIFVLLIPNGVYNGLGHAGRDAVSVLNVGGADIDAGLGGIVCGDAKFYKVMNFIDVELGVSRLLQLRV